MKDFWWPSTIPRIQMPTNLVQFYREYVSQSKPCIIVGAFDQWNAMKLWDIDYLMEKAGHLEISADLTPSGHGDCVTISPGYDPHFTYSTPDSVPVGEVYDPSRCFVKPLQEKVLFSKFLSELQKHQEKLRKADPTASSDEVYYLQHQNDSFRKEFVKTLGEDLDDSIERFGSELFGCSPDAINFWAGDSRAVSSMHKDHYENLYCVVRGTKKFTLLPPSDLPWLNQHWFREANFERDENGKLKPVLQQPEHAIPWIPIDPDMETEERRKLHPRAANISPLHVEVQEGEMLYLPALVYHKVAQKGDEKEGKVIAINYWFDMQFGTSYTYYKLVEAMVSQRDTKERQKASKA
jgi:jumonji domain-containing protein 7